MRACVLAIVLAACSSPSKAPPAAAPASPLPIGSTAAPNCGSNAVALCNSSSCSGCPCTSYACVSTERTCTTVADCAAGEGCFCRGVGEDPCHGGMTEAACHEAQCGGRICSVGAPQAPP